MTLSKVVNFILFIGLIALAMFWQSLEPRYQDTDFLSAYLFRYGWIAGLVLTAGAVAAGIVWVRRLKTGKVRPAEAVFAGLVAISAFWISVTLFREWQVLSRIK